MLVKKRYMKGQKRYSSSRTSVGDKRGSSHLTASAVVTIVIIILIIFLYESERSESFKPQKSEHSTKQRRHNYSLTVHSIQTTQASGKK